jgi:hypothetical protein
MKEFVCRHCMIYICLTKYFHSTFSVLAVLASPLIRIPVANRAEPRNNKTNLFFQKNIVNLLFYQQNRDNSCTYLLIGAITQDYYESKF